MKRIFATAVVTLIIIFAHGQSSVEMSKYATQYKEFQPAKIYMMLGDTIKASANIFLKNSSLYFMRGSLMMQADMHNVVAVDFGDNHYVKIDTLLAVVVGNYKGNQLLCTRQIDIEAFITMKKNATMVTNMDFSLNNYLNVQKMETSNGDEEFPIHRIYFFYYNGKYVRVNDRDLYKFIPKEKRGVYNTITQMDEFDWYNETWLMKLLKYIS
jgi:hypothetical protein